MPGVSELARQAAEAEQPLFGAPERSRQYDVFAVSQRAIAEPLVHPSHRVVDEDLIGIASDPVCQECRLSLYDSPDALRAPCKAVKASPVTAVNPKELAGAKKPATWSVMPRWVVLLVGRVMSVGAAKYGAFNYRETPIAASTYQDALERHVSLWFDGEDTDAESGVSHLAHAMACCALLLDAQATGKLVDDRQKTGIVRRTLDELERLIKNMPLPAPHVA